MAPAPLPRCFSKNSENPMKITSGIAALAAGAMLVACTAEAPTEPNMSVFEADAVSFARASGAIPSGDVTLADHDGNGNGLVCVKTVPAGNGQAPERTIVKDDNKNGCPGGFEETSLDDPGDLPICAEAQPIGDPAECICEDAGGLNLGGLCFFPT